MIGSSHPANSQGRTLQVEPITRFSDEVNKAINKNNKLFLQYEAVMLEFEENFNDERTFIEKYASGDVKDVVALNVSGTMMITARSTLCVAEDSVLAQQFDDSKWTEQGPRVEEWWLMVPPSASSTVNDEHDALQLTQSSLIKADDVYADYPAPPSSRRT